MNALPDIDPSGQVSLDRIAAGVPQQAAGRKYVIINNVPYAMVLERGRVQGPPASGSYQAPNGMVGLAVVEFQQTVDEAVAEMSKT